MDTPENTFDVVIIGGALAGSATALQLLRRNPDLDIALVEKSTAFTRRVGESTVEVSAHFLGKVLGFSEHLNRQHIVKQGLRFHFQGPESTSLYSCGEIGPVFNVKFPAYQVDRSLLDTHLLEAARAAGARIFRPAKVTRIQLPEAGAPVDVTLKTAGDTQDLRCRWIVDASGLASVLGRQLKLIERNHEHPISSVWARYRNVENWDTRSGDAGVDAWRRRVIGLRDTATNHLIGPGYWIWVIPLVGGAYSIGVVYDQRLVELPPGPSLGERLSAFIRSHPGGEDLLAGAEVVEGDVLARSNLAYRARQTIGERWALVGDAAAFIDPFYSPGMDWLAFTSAATARIVGDSLTGQDVCERIAEHNRHFALSYERWFKAVYKDKYHYQCDLELMDLAFRLDLGLYYLGVVRRYMGSDEDALTLPPFAHPHSGPAAALMACYNRRFARIAQRRARQGRLGARNRNFRPFLSYSFDGSLVRRLLWVLLRWGLLELREAAQGLRLGRRRGPPQAHAAPPETDRTTPIHETAAPSRA